MTNVLGRTSVGFERGFNDQQTELAIDSLEVKGALPGWLSGTLVRNGPARFRLDDKTLNHWFDGLAMLHKFDIATIGRIAEQFVAQTEYPMPVAFDPQTLDTIGVVSFDDRLKGAVTTAHPHHDPDERAAYNYLLNLGATCAYGVYRLPDGTRTRELLGQDTTKRPSYMHSFALSERYVILMEFPLAVNPLRRRGGRLGCSRRSP